MDRRILSFNYTLKDNKGQVLDSSNDGPLAFLEGARQILPKLESELSTLNVGDKKNVKLAAADAYGVSNPKMIIDVPQQELSHLKIEVGSFLQLDTGNQLKMVRVTNISDSSVTLDGNHPLAGMDLEFDVEMVEVRAATEEEINHGHAHGIGGHQH
jgi:FKBP-type peptidyl-prolyl cis-trans isomerase SlyD